MKKKKNFYIITEFSSDHDGSVTFSYDLVKELRLRKETLFNREQYSSQSNNVPFIFMFWNPDRRCFSFCKKNALFASKSQCSPIAFDPESETYGFTASNPNIPYLYYHLNINSHKVKFTVERQKTANDMIYNMTSYEFIDK